MMPRRKNQDVPIWVRSTVCIVGCLSLPGLILAATLGVEVTTELAVPVAVTSSLLVKSALVPKGASSFDALFARVFGQGRELPEQ